MTHAQPCQPRDNRTITVDFRSDATYFQLPAFCAMKEGSHWGEKCSKVHSYKEYIPSQRVKERKCPLAERSAPWIGKSKALLRYGVDAPAPPAGRHGALEAVGEDWGSRSFGAKNNDLL